MKLVVICFYPRVKAHSASNDLLLASGCEAGECSMILATTSETGFSSFRSRARASCTFLSISASLLNLRPSSSYAQHSYHSVQFGAAIGDVGPTRFNCSRPLFQSQSDATLVPTDADAAISPPIDRQASTTRQQLTRPANGKKFALTSRAVAFHAARLSKLPRHPS